MASIRTPRFSQIPPGTNTLSSVAHAERVGVLLFKSPSNWEKRAREVKAITGVTESPVQIILLGFLMLKGVLLFPFASCPWWRAPRGSRGTWRSCGPRPSRRTAAGRRSLYFQNEDTNYRASRITEAASKLVLVETAIKEHRRDFFLR